MGPPKSIGIYNRRSFCSRSCVLAGNTVIIKAFAEIAGDRALQLYGAALATVNVITTAYWLFESPAPTIVDRNLRPVCWPIVPDCQFLRVLDAPQVSAVIVVFALLSIVNAVLFLDRQVKSAYWLLFACTIIKSYIILLDYRLVLNQHYMALWITVPFLLVPSQRKVIKYLLVSFYFWAGILKLYPGSGWFLPGAFYGRRPLGLPISLIPAETAYVVVLELVVVFGVLSRRKFIFWSALLQLVLFHFASFWVVGFFYPLEMLSLLSILILDRSISESVPLQWQWRRYCAATIAAGFAICQLAPLALPGNRAITGEGRLFALNMFDAPVECRAEARFTGVPVPRVVPIRVPFLNARITCDPIVYWSVARSFCGARGSGPTDDFELSLESRLTGQQEYRRVISISSFCTVLPKYEVWRHNPWIAADESSSRR